MARQNLPSRVFTRHALFILNLLLLTIPKKSGTLISNSKLYSWLKGTGILVSSSGTGGIGVEDNGMGGVTGGHNSDAGHGFA